MPGVLEKARSIAIQRARLFWATAETIIREPQAFFVHYFAFAGTRFSDAPPEGKATTFVHMKPFQFLGYAIGISAALLPLTQLAVLDIARQDAHLFAPDFVDIFGDMRGPPIPGIDLKALTGIPFVDPALAGAARYGAYFLFGVLFWAMAPKHLTVKTGAHCFAYLVAVSLVALAAFRLIAGLLQATVGLGLRDYMVLDFLSETATVAYILVMPSFFLPAVLKVERRVVINAMLWGLRRLVRGPIALRPSSNRHRHSHTEFRPGIARFSVMKRTGNFRGAAFPPVSITC